MQTDPQLERAVKDGEAFLERELDAVTSTTVTLRVPTDVRDKLDAIARHEERSLNGQAVYFLRGAIAQYEQTESVRPSPLPLAKVPYRGADTTAP